MNLKLIEYLMTYIRINQIKKNCLSLWNKMKTI